MVSHRRAVTLRQWCLRLCLFAAVVVSSSSVAAQRLHIRNYGSEDGLRGSPVRDIYQDRRGLLWIVSDTGINRFDGVSFTHITGDDGLRSPSVYTVEEWGDRGLWFGSDHPMVYDGRQLHDALPDRGEGHRWAIDPQGIVWFARDDNLCAFDGTAVHTYGPKEGIPPIPDAYKIRPYADELWIGTRTQGAFQVRREGLRITGVRHYTEANGVPHRMVRDIVRDREGHVYFGTRGGGVARLDANGMKVFDTRTGLTGNDIYTMLITRKGQLVIGTFENGISICDLPNVDHCRTVTVENGLVGRSVFALYEDREGAIWVALANGVSKVILDGVESYTEREGLPLAIYSILPESDGKVWVGTLEGLAMKEGSSSQWKVFTTKDGLASNEVQALVRDHRGTLWAGTARGLCRMERDSRFHCPWKNISSDGEDYVLDVMEAGDGSLWVGAGGYVAHIAGERIEHVYPQLGSNYSLAEDKQGRIWIGSDRGLFVHEGGKITQFHSNVLNGSVNSVYRDRDGGIWIGTTGQRLLYKPPDSDRLQPVGKERGIDADTIVAMTEDASGHLWVGGSGGLYEVDRNAVRSGAQRVVAAALDERHGLVGREVVTPNAAALAPDGTLWFGFSQGMSHFDPRKHAKTSAVPPPVVLIRTEVRNLGIFNAPFSALSKSTSAQWLSANRLGLTHDQNDLRFEFRGLSFNDERGVRFRHWLEGYESGWSAPTSEPYKEYTNLSPGTYRFRVIAENNEGARSEQEATLGFDIKPPFWRTSSFAALLLLAVTALVITAWKLRVRAMEVRTHELESVVTTRTSDLQARTKALEEANDRASEADRMKNRFLANVSHELRTPLNAIIGFSELLLGRMTRLTFEKQNQFVENINLSGHHLLHVINNLLDLSKIEAGKMEVVVDEVPLEEIIGTVERVIRGFAAPRGVNIRVTMPEELPEVRLDSSKVKQILYNLLSNAIKFSPPRGTVTISVEEIGAVSSPLGVDSIAIGISDQGIGIAPEDVDKIFVEFHQVRSSQRIASGTGLGLCIVQEFAEMQGGRVGVTSTLGVGSTFRVVLPVDASSFATSRVTDATQDSSPPKTSAAK